MDVEKLRYFRIVAQEQHITRAAQKINITQPSLSSIISNMENELGVKLFDRVGRQIVLNKYGKVFYEGIDAMLDTYDSTIAKVEALKVDNVGDIKIAVTGLNFPKKLLSAFAREFPQLRIIMKLIRTDEILSTLKHANSGIVLSAVNCIDENIHSELLYEEDMYLVVSENHPYANREEISIRSLRNERWAMTPVDTAFRTKMDEIFKQAGYKPNICIEAYTEQNIQMIIETQAVTMVSRSDRKTLPEREHLRFIKLSDDYCRRGIYMLSRSDIPLTENEQSFYEFAFYEKESYVPQNN